MKPIFLLGRQILLLCQTLLESRGYAQSVLWRWYRDMIWDHNVTLLKGEKV